MTPRVLLTALLAAALFASAARAQVEAPADVGGEIALETSQELDARIEQRLSAIYGEMGDLASVTVEASQGVVRLGGVITSPGAAQRAEEIALRLEGVAAVEDQIERELGLSTNLAIVFEDVRGWVRDWPLYLLAAVLFLALVAAGHLLGSWTALWGPMSPNVFIARLLGQIVRLAFFFAALMIALGLLGATALIGAFIGGAGLIGLAVGFAVRDTIENYIASIMLSIRQPFRADDHVVINEHEGLVARLTSRATVLMTLEGNHLRIPNADVFKAVILNYTRNPERRFDFVLSVDAADDPIEAINAGLEAMRKLDFILASPEAQAVIVQVGESSIPLRFMGWVNQRDADFLKARSLAINATKTALEAAGFTLPEPIYRLRFDEAGAPERVAEAVPKPAERPPRRARAPEGEGLDVTPDRHMARKAEEERAETREADLLDDRRPTE